MERNSFRATLTALAATLAFVCSSCSFTLLNLESSAKADRNIGINLFASQLDWVEDRLLADAMKTAREWTAPNQYGSGAAVGTDSDGWPTRDAECVVWNGLAKMNGNYFLEGEANSRPTITAGFGDAEIHDFKYQGGRFSATIVYKSTNGVGLLLTFTGTNGGVRNVKLMRPRTVGSSIPYSTATTFTNQAKKMVDKFKVIRFMWAIDAWNGPWQAAWADRVSPAYCSYNRGAGSTINSTTVGWAGKGMAWEVAIQFANETGKDLWLNMPIGANDDYIYQLARLARDTYTVPNGKIYWEYSNEATWDLLGVCSAYLRAQATSDGTVGYDGSTDVNVRTARYYVKRAAQMSEIWRSVWGDSNMMTRIRPIASGQLTYDTELIWGLEFLNNYYNNGDGTVHAAAPHPVSYYFYGCGGSHYTGDDPDSLDSGVREIDKFESYEEEEACLAKIFGLRRCAYEGGVWTNDSEYRLPRITDAMIRYQALWDKYDGDLLMYYVTDGGEDKGTALGFTQDAFDLDTPKYRALDSILAKARPAAGAGHLAPCVIPGADFSVNSTPWLHPAPAGAETLGGVEFGEWNTFKGYLFRTTKDGRYSINLAFRETTDAQIEITVDGKLLASGSISGRNASYSLILSSGLHGVRVKKLNPGYFYLNSIQIN
jgi:hypothetical protein